ncbi:MAG: aspartyl/glutamyl-tRNA amidotransferase subunit C [Eubacteriales bacterium]|nr:aspartyl/glutamyl-tRNA amidotransferase subunit C [Eubacteriales bacterium]
MITRKEIQRLGELSALEIPPEEEEGLLRDLASLVALADVVAQGGFDGEEPPAECPCSALRKDEVTASLPRDDALRNASARQGEYFSTIPHSAGGETA